MGVELQPDERKALEGANSDLERRFPIALALYAVLAALVWFTMGDEKVFVHGKWVDLRLVPLVVIGGLAARTFLARQADRIRRQSGNGSGSSSL
jgi:hypothetical protein